MKKDFIPENIEELEKLYYGENRDGTNVDYELIKKYDDKQRTKIISPQFEKEVIEIFKPVGNFVKIPREDNKQTFDLKNDQEKILIEVTSLDSGIDSQTIVTENKILSKLLKATNHIIEKDKVNYQNYYLGGVIFYTTLFNFLSKIGNLIGGKGFITKSKIFERNIDFLLILPESASNSRDIFPPVIYVKNKNILKLFTEKFSSKNYKIIFLEK